MFEGRNGPIEGVLLFGAGFTEVQRSADEAGFQFGPSDDGQVEAAGPEMSVGIKARYWVGGRSYFTGDVTAGAAYVVGAPLVMGWSNPVLPFASVTVGMGL